MMLCLAGLIGVSSLAFGQTGPLRHVSRMMATTAQVVERLRDLTSTVFRNSEAAVDRASSVAASMVDTSLSAAEAAWHGIDLTDVQAETNFTK